jgi:hypothetical protein
MEVQIVGSSSGDATPTVFIICENTRCVCYTQRTGTHIAKAIASAGL